MEANQTLTLVNYHVVSGMDFSQPTEPMLTLIPAKKVVYINAACFRRLPELEYAQFAVYDEEKRLILKPCSANSRDYVRVKSAGINSSRAKRIRGCEFMRKVMLLMGWDINCRYKARGYVFRGGKETFLLFDLASALVLSPDSGQQRRDDEFIGASIESSDIPLLRTFTRNTEICSDNTEVNSDEYT